MSEVRIDRTMRRFTSSEMLQRLDWNEASEKRAERGAYGRSDQYARQETQAPIVQLLLGTQMDALPSLTFSC